MAAYDPARSAGTRRRPTYHRFVSTGKLPELPSWGFPDPGPLRDELTALALAGPADRAGPYAAKSSRQRRRP